MSNRELNIILRLKDQMSEELQKVKGEFDNFSQTAEEVGFNFGKTGAVMTGVGAGLGGLLVKTGLTAARTETLGVAMEAVAKSTGTSMAVIKEQEKALKEQGITTQEARRTLIKFMQAGLDLSKAGSVARVAQDLAVFSENGESSSETAARLVHGITTLNTMVLRNAGSVVDLDRAYNEYAETLGKSASDLTSAEKQAAAMNAVLEDGENYAGTYEAAMGTAGKQLGSLARHIETASENFGEAFLPVMALAIEATTDLLEWFNGLSEETQTLITKTVMVGAALTLVSGGLLLFIAGVQALTPLAVILTAVMAGVGIVALYIVKNWDKLKAGVDVVKEAFINAGEKLKEIWVLITEATRGAVDFVVKKLTEFWQRFDNAIILVVGAITGLYLPKLAIMAAQTTVQIAKVIAQWVLMASKSLMSAGTMTLRAIPQIIASLGKLVVSTTVAVAKIVAKWVLMGVQSLIQAGRMAVAWVIAMGPVAWVSALVVALAALIIKNWDKIAVWTEKVWGTVAGFLSDKWESMKEGASVVWEAIVGIFEWAHEKIMAVLNPIIKTAEKAIDLARRAKEMAGGVVSGARQRVSSLIDKVTPFADGGIVTRPTLGLVGEAGPEAIIPLNKMSGFGNINITISNNSFMGEDDMAEKVGDKIMNIIKQSTKI